MDNLQWQYTGFEVRSPRGNNNKGEMRSPSTALSAPIKRCHGHITPTIISSTCWLSANKLKNKHNNTT